MLDPPTASPPWLLNANCPRFRWAQCQLDTLELCSSSEEIDEALRSLPKDLPATYERILARVDGKRFKSVWTVLVSLAFAHKPLTIDEMINILRIDPRAKPPTKNIPIYHKALLASCSSLVLTFSEATRDMDSGKLGSPKAHLRLAHLSVKEYLVSEEIRQSAVAAFGVSHGLGNRVMAELCLGCLLQNNDVLSFGLQTLDTFPFTTYAAVNWGRHARDANGEETGRELLDSLLLDLLHSGTPEAYTNLMRAANQVALMETIDGVSFAFLPPWEQGRQPAVEPPQTHSTIQAALLHSVQYHVLITVAAHNLWRVMERILRTWQPGPLEMFEAMREGLSFNAYESLEVLFALGKPDINLRYGYSSGKTLLENCRSPRGVSWLVAHGADVHPAGPQICPPLHRFCELVKTSWFAESGPIMVETLLKAGANPNVVFEECYGIRRTVYLATPLQIASYRGNVKCVGLLLDHGAAVNLMAGEMGSSLHAAAVGGRKEVFDYLLSRGADIHAVSETYGSVLSAAGHGCGEQREIIETCLERGLSWDDFVDTKLESVRGRQWKTLDYETQTYLATHIIRSTHEQHYTLAEAARAGVLGLDEALQLVQGFGLQYCTIQQFKDSYVRCLGPGYEGVHWPLWEYPFQGPSTKLRR